jgi:hypothetical protein
MEDDMEEGCINTRQKKNAQKIWSRNPKVLLDNLDVQDYIITNSMEQSPSWEAKTPSATQEIPRSFWNLNVHHRIHKSPQPIPILSHIDPVYAPRKSILILSSHLRLGLPSGLIPSGFPTKALYRTTEL